MVSLMDDASGLRSIIGPILFSNQA